MIAGVHEHRVLTTAQRLWTHAIAARAPAAVIRGAALEFRALFEDVTRAADADLVKARRIHGHQEQSQEQHA
jgi:hypothetical protein